MILGGLVCAAALLAATAAGYGALSEQSGPRLATDVPAPLARSELCAALIRADQRQVLARLARGDDGGAGFASRNDQFRADWILQQLQAADAGRDWRARVEALADKVPALAADPGYAASAHAYVECLAQQNGDGAFTEALHASLGYRDLP